MSHEVIDNDERAITALQLKELQACLQSENALQRDIFGMIIGGSIAAMSLKFSSTKFPSNVVFPYVGLATLSGLIMAKYFRLKTCKMKMKDSNYKGSQKNWELTHKDTMYMYGNGKDKLEDQELAKTEVLPKNTEEFVSDIEYQPRLSMLDEFPSIYKSANIPNNKERERTVTYEELRERNRQAYKTRNIVQKPIEVHDHKIEQSAQEEGYETESKKSEPFHEQSLGKHKTKYEDVWD